jgi:hypothetical protein
MKLSRVLLPFFASLALLAAAFAEDDAPTPLEFKRLDLLDGRKLRNVVVKSYDQNSGRVLLVADGKATTVPLGLIPPPFSEMLRKGAPASGASVTTHPAGNPARAPSAPRSPNQTASAAPPDSSAVDTAAHRAVALDRALTFYRYEFVAGSAAMRVDSVKIDAEPTKPVPGWSGRYRTIGKAYLELFDTKGWSATRAQSSFEIITEQKPNEPPAVIDFTRKS